MFLADEWKDYKLLDASCGERLESWGDYILIRPDPQAIWKSEKSHPLWKKANAHYHRSKSGGGSWQIYDLPESWQIKYKNLTFNIKPMNFKHTGIFPEQAVNWDFMSNKIENAGRRVSVLNLLHIPAVQLWLVRQPVQMCAMSTPQRVWFSGQRITRRLAV